MTPYTLSTPEGRAEVRRLVEAATPGPWEHRVAGIEGDSYIAATGPWKRLRSSEQVHEDAALIAAAPTLLLAALEEIERLERELASSRAGLAEIRPGVWQAPSVRSVFSDGRDARCQCEVWQTCPYCHPEPKEER